MVAERLAECLRPGDTIARLGGDEFAVLLEELREPGDAARAAQRLLDALRRRSSCATASSSSARASDRGRDQDDAETLLRDADLAMYRAKSRGKGRYAVFEPGMHTAIVERLELEVDLKRALEREELVLVYQPIFSLVTGAVAGVEALVRWRHPTRGIVLPERLRPAGGGERPDRRARPVGAPEGLPPGRAVAREDTPAIPGLRNRRQRLRRPAARARPGAGGLGRARRRRSWTPPA